MGNRDGLYEQLSVVCLWTGNARLVDQDEPGFERLSSTSNSTISASTRRGIVRRNVPSGVNSWRQLCPVKDAPLDDDDDNCDGSSTVRPGVRPRLLRQCFLIYRLRVPWDERAGPMGQARAAVEKAAADY